MPALASDLSGTVTAVKGQRVTLVSKDRTVTVSVPAGTQIKTGDAVTVSVETVGDALLARKVVIQRK